MKNLLLLVLSIGLCSNANGQTAAQQQSKTDCEAAFSLTQLDLFQADNAFDVADAAAEDALIWRATCTDPDLLAAGDAAFNAGATFMSLGIKEYNAALADWKDANLVKVSGDLEWEFGDFEDAAERYDTATGKFGTASVQFQNAEDLFGDATDAFNGAATIWSGISGGGPGGGM